MSGKFPRQSHPEPSEPPEQEGFTYDWTAPGYTQPNVLGVSPATETIPGHDPRPDAFLNPKVAIPRATFPSPSSNSGRVSRACENCREQKAKCSGHRPACHRCQDGGLRCSYGDRKHERMRKSDAPCHSLLLSRMSLTGSSCRQLEELSAQVQSYESMLRELYPHLNPSCAQLVDRTLGTTSVKSATTLGDQDAEPGLGYPSPAIDYTEEDFNREGKVQSLGFVGEHSEIAWLHRLKWDIDHDDTTPVGEIADRPAVSTLSYFQDDTDISNIDVLDLSARPPSHVSDKLVHNYFQTVHPAFPIIGKTIFLGQYRSFYSNPSLRPGYRWMAMLNLIFALAARHSLMSGTQSVCGPDDDRVYFARAWRLGVGPVTLLDHPNLQQVQVEGLASFYLLSIGQVNRSWRVIGTAMRSAVAMGLNLRSESDRIAHVSKETRYRVWWALFSLDTVLCVMTGRPPTTSEVFCTTPLPVPYREEDYWDENVMSVISDQDLRTALATALLSHNMSPGPTEASPMRQRRCRDQSPPMRKLNS
ncbi:hypothetical protein N7492_003075 [Penicillium capsulatum]|uniref:Zn(2)-C6 fungal-type domain-containing protein n=1 Tax=Penicillium capsulatum TaxID=69766 RepID=A0A9W9IMZ6_9EURO|nr:hypothetical protein N7492_003075 [Penicillium capsulatum]KAJ6122334.1 hypothetical protein N7512_004799 [Penicillium capsulatum]